MTNREFLLGEVYERKLTPCKTYCWKKMFCHSQFCFIMLDTNYILISFFFGCTLWCVGFLVSQPGIEPVPPTLKVQDPKLWTTREVQQTIYYCLKQSSKGFLYPSCGHLGYILEELSPSESGALNICKQIWENSAVVSGLEKVSFPSNPKERQCQRMLKLLHSCTHLTH